MIRVLMLLIVLGMVTSLQAQPPALSERELLRVVQAYHPVARQALLRLEEARAEVRIARGAFDPTATFSRSQKEMEGLTYYTHSQQEVRIPTWYGIDLRAGVESYSGERLNPSDTKGSVSYVGVSVPVLRNLVLDKRRTALRQARLLSEASLAEQRQALNNLFYEALKAYRTWWQHYHTAQLFRDAMTNAQKRMAMVRTAYQLGERPAIDTLEAYTQVQAFQLREAEITLEITKARLELSVFLWTEGGTPYNLPAEAVPLHEAPAPKEDTLLDERLKALAQHPELQQYHYKLAALQLDKRLSFQALLPSVHLHYNQLGKEQSLKQTLTAPWLHNNYRYGVTMSMPLRLSEARGSYQKAGLKLKSTLLEQAHKRATLEAKVKGAYAQWQQLRQQLQVQHAAVANYQLLQRGEEVKFFNGESSLFLINSREAKTLEAREKLITLTAKEHLAYYGLQWAAGQLIQL